MKIEVQNLTKKYRNKVVLSDINLKFENKVYGLMGPNGSGKTTLIRILLDLVNPTNGTIIYKKNEDKLINLKNISIGYLPQSFDVFEDYSVEEQLEYFSILKKINKVDRDVEINKVLELTNLTKERKKRCSELSGGMKRRLGIAQSFLGKPDIVILDEPTVGLDPYERIRFKELMKKIEIICPIILSTHIIEDISNLCSDVIVLRDGRVLYEGTTLEFINPTNIFVYNVDSDKLQFVKEEIIKIRIDNGYKIISNSRLNYSFLQESTVTVDDAYLFISKYKRIDSMQ